MSHSEEIDFVVLWVDGADESWRKKQRLYKKEYIAANRILSEIPEAANDIRYIELGTLRYLLRSIETFCPWYRYIHLVVDGQTPEWLDINHDKIRIVDHKEIFKDPKDLPTFNCHAIHVNLHNIPGLAERFILCDDDFLILKSTDPSFFFKGGKPVDFFRTFRPMQPPRTIFEMNFYQNMLYMRAYRRFGWMLQLFRFGSNGRLYLGNGKSLLLGGFRLQLLKYSHFCQPYLKSTWLKAWDKFGETMRAVSASKFREPWHITQYLFRGIQLLDGDFVPCREPRGCMVALQNQPLEENEQVIMRMINSGYSLGCITESMQLNIKEMSQELREAVDRSMSKCLPFSASFELNNDQKNQSEVG